MTLRVMFSSVKYIFCALIKHMLTMPSIICQIDSTDLFHLRDVLWFSHNSLGHDDERILFCTNDPHVKLILF